jgi:MFS transporter, CP family, cyanate transporter
LTADAGPRPPSALWFAAIVLVAANLRPTITSVPPLVDQLTATFHLSAVAAGALTTLPVVAMGLFAPVAALAARRFGDPPVLAAAVALIALGAGARSLGGLPGLYAGTAVAGIGIAVAGALLPSLVRARTPDRVGPVTGLYTAALIGGALVAAGSSEPVRAGLGVDAQVALGVWAAPALIALAVCVVEVRDGRLARSSPSARLARPAVRFPWRSRPAWWGTLFMGAQSLLFYGALAWLAPDYIGHGLSARDAGLLLALFSGAQMITAFAMPALAHRIGGIRLWIAVSVGLTIVGLFLVAVVPMVAPWLWIGLTGLGMGGNLSLALTVLTQAAPTPEGAAAYTGMAFFVGYLLAAAGPVMAGALRDATGGFTAVFLALAALGVITLVLGVAAARPPVAAGP